MFFIPLVALWSNVLMSGSVVNMDVNSAGFKIFKPTLQMFYVYGNALNMFVKAQ